MSVYHTSDKETILCFATTLSTSAFYIIPIVGIENGLSTVKSVCNCAVCFVSVYFRIEAAAVCVYAFIQWDETVSKEDDVNEIHFHFPFSTK